MAYCHSAGKLGSANTIGINHDGRICLNRINATSYKITKPRSNLSHNMSFFPRKSMGGELFTCFCTLCNAIKFMDVRSSAAAVKNADGSRKKWDGHGALLMGEGVCISAAVASNAASFFRPAPQTIQQHFGSPTWQLIPLWLALLINVIFRFIYQQQQYVPIGGDSSLQRVAKLEEELRTSVVIIQALTRQVEKLGVRYHETKRRLRDTIQEVSKLAGSTSEVIKVLASRENILESEVREFHHALTAMQEQQEKQLNLIAKLAKNSANLRAGTEKRTVHKESEDEWSSSLTPSNGSLHSNNKLS